MMTTKGDISEDLLDIQVAHEVVPAGNLTRRSCYLAGELVRQDIHIEVTEAALKAAAEAIL